MLLFHHSNHQFLAKEYCPHNSLYSYGLVLLLIAKNQFLLKLSIPIPSAVQRDNAAYQKVKVVAVIFFSFTNKCYIPTILFPNHLFSPEFTVLLQKVSN